jgi:diguanylate cyclase (GGDEF)-like protein/PAS domain S-box-containing protein
MNNRPARACFVAWVALLAAVYYAWPESRMVTWSLIGLSAAAAVVIGVRVNRPSRPLPWMLLAGGVLLFLVGDTLYNGSVALGVTPPYPDWSDLSYLLMYPLIAVGLLMFVRAGASGHNRAALLDALVPTVSLGLLAYVFLIAPYTRGSDNGMFDRLVSIAYPMGDILALAILLRLFAAPGRKPFSAKLLAVAAAGLLASDVVYGLARLDESWAIGGPVDLGWVLFNTAIGLAGLHPSMRGLTEQPERAESEEAPSVAPRLAMMVCAALIAPAVLLAEYLLLERVVDAPVIAAAAALMFLLVLARVGGLLADQRGANQRERALRRATASLARAATADDILDSVREAIATIMPEDGEYHLVTLEGGDAAGEAGPGSLHVSLRVPGPPDRHVEIRLSAPEATLRTVRPAVRALFAQVDVVVQRIALAGEISRRDSEAYFRTLVQSASDVILIVGDDDRVRYASPSATAVFGHPELVGFPLTRLVADTHHEILAGALERARSGRGSADGVDLAVVCADRRLLQVECTSRDLRDDPTVRGLVVTVRDVTERRRLENDLAHQAFHDGLTGLANRVLFRNRLEHEYARAELAGAGLGVLFVDLDDFKEVNDTLGHAIGDQLLQQVARRITQAVGGGDTAARMGGDEFAILVEHGDTVRAQEVATRVVEALRVPVELSDGLGGSHVVSGAASVGVATNADAKSPTELLRHADLALYLAKGAGKGGWQHYRAELHDAMVERLALRTSLHEAVEREQFVLQYQPIVDVKTQIVMGVEALVRWQHPERGLLGPYHFIELAEESGAIIGIGDWVLREALRQVVRWPRVRYVSVNVSARQFRQPGFVDRVRDALAASGAEPFRLLLEITESLVLRDAEQVWADLEELRALGVRIAIDDFGTGYSSLSYLRQMPVDVLKIDKSFIDDILASKQQRALVNAIVTLARNLNLTVVAEGIEDADQRAMLARMGCPYGQGYLFSKPVWPEDVPALTGVVVTA